MKKIFTLMAALFMGITMSAQEETPLYTAVAQADAFGEDWVEDGYDPATCMFTDVDDITVEVYDGYTILRKWCGVEGYDVCLIHDEGAELEWGNISEAYDIINGEEKDTNYSGGYHYLKTGREDYPKAALYAAYSNISTSAEEQNGQILLCQYLYDSNNKYNAAQYYYYLYWGYDEEDAEDAIEIIKTHKAKQPRYNLAGQQVGKGYKGIVVRDGKKMLVK